MTLAVDEIPVQDQIDTRHRIDVPKNLTDAQVQAYVDNGFHVQAGQVSPEELKELKADMVKLARGGYPCKNLKPIEGDLSDAEVLNQILCIHQPHYISPIIEKYVKHPGICGTLSQITAAHLPHWDGSVKCMQSMMFVKGPGFQGQAWHQDEVYIPTRDRSLIGAWIALEDATIENGCLWVVPGSHKNGYMFPQRPNDNPEEFDFAPESFGFDENEEVPVEVKAGTVVYFNGYLLHRSRKNRSETYRKVLVNHYCNAWSLLPWHLKEGERPANADVRKILPVSGVDPYSWKGIEKPEQEVYLRQCAKTKDSE